MYKNKTVSAIINCAGNGTRFGKNKLVQSISVNNDFTSETVIVRTIKNFLLPEIDEIIVTVNQKYLTLYQKMLLEEEKLPVKLVLGGSERYLSALNGLQSASSQLVLLHDGVRPFVTRDLILSLLAATNHYQAAILAVPATTTIKVIDPETKVIRQSLARQSSWLAQTPQVFDRQLLIRAYQQAIANHYQIVSDDSELITRFFPQEKIAIVPGHETNLKITFPLDLKLAQLIDLEQS